MHLTTLPARALKRAINRRAQPGMIVARHQPYARQPARLQIAEDRLIRRRTFRICHIDREDRPFPVIAHPTDDQDAVACHLPIGADIFVAVIHREVRIAMIRE